MSVGSGVEVVMRYFVRAGFSSLDSNLDFIFVVSTMLLNEIIVVNLMWREKVMQQPRGGRSVEVPAATWGLFSCGERED